MSNCMGWVEWWAVFSLTIGQKLTLNGRCFLGPFVGLWALGLTMIASANCLLSSFLLLPPNFLAARQILVFYVSLGMESSVSCHS